MEALKTVANNSQLLKQAPEAGAVTSNESERAVVNPKSLLGLGRTLCAHPVLEECACLLKLALYEGGDGESLNAPAHATSVIVPSALW